jgi:hypothetical protein
MQQQMTPVAADDSTADQDESLAEVHLDIVDLSEPLDD